ASSDRTVKLWNPVSGGCEATLEGHVSWKLAALPGGRLASAAWGETIRLWDPASDTFFEAGLKGHTGVVYALAVLADGRLVSGSEDKTIKLWAPASGTCEATFQGHADAVRELAVLADGRIASGSEDKSIKLW